MRTWHNKFFPLLHRKWEAHPAQPDFITAYDPETGAPLLIAAPVQLRDLLLELQNNLSMQLQYVEQLALELEAMQSALESLEFTPITSEAQ